MLSASLFSSQAILLFSFLSVSPPVLCSLFSPSTRSWRNVGLYESKAPKAERWLLGVKDSLAPLGLVFFLHPRSASTCLFLSDEATFQALQAFIHFLFFLQFYLAVYEKVFKRFLYS